MLSPSVWFGLVIAGVALLQDLPRDRVRVAFLIVVVALFLRDSTSPDHYTVWTPYQQIEYSRAYAQNGEMVSGNVKVNHTGYQYITNLSSEFLLRHPELLKQPVDENPYNMPFRFAVPSPSVLIVGSGTGNDAAAALRHESQLVDAVEIDPAIAKIGRQEHPEHPYDSPRVSLHVTDARAFLKRTSQQYDLILFGLLDSHTQLSDYSNMRLDNFVYTEESLREAKAHLKPDGVLFVKFNVNHPWIATRLKEMLEEAFGKSPVVFFVPSYYSVDATCFAISPSGRIEEALGRDAQLARFVAAHHVVPGGPGVPVTTDDWPYLYQRDRAIPRTYLVVSILVILIASALYLQVSGVGKGTPSLFFFSMGAGFLLLETQAVSRLGFILWHHLGGQWDCDLRSPGGLAGCECGCRPAASDDPAFLDHGGVGCRVASGLWISILSNPWPTCGSRRHRSRSLLRACVSGRSAVLFGVSKSQLAEYGIGGQRIGRSSRRVVRERFVARWNASAFVADGWRVLCGSRRPMAAEIGNAPVGKGGGCSLTCCPHTNKPNGSYPIVIRASSMN